MNIGNPSPIAQEYVTRGRSESCPVIDMHGHLGPFHGGHLPVAPLAGMKESLRRAGVTRIVCCSHAALFDDLKWGNALTQRVIDDCPDLFLGYWAVNPNHPAAQADLKREFEAARGFVGLKLLPDYHASPLTGHAYAPALEYADAEGLLVLVHTWGRSAFNSPRQLEIVAKKHPRAAFIMGHSGYGDWEAAISAARDLPNVYLDLTAVYVAHDFAMLPSGSGTPLPLLSCLQVNGVIEYMVENCSSRKILLGTDMPWYSPHYAVGTVLFARITDDDRRNILFRNATQLLSAALSQRAPQSRDSSGNRANISRARS